MVLKFGQKLLIIIQNDKFDETIKGNYATLYINVT